MTGIRRFDLIVVGGGPAGSAAALRALQLRPERSVLVLDSASFPRDKVCGDGIGPHAVDELARIGATGVLRGYPEIHRLRLRAPSGAEAARILARPNHVVPRRVFDDRLRDIAILAGAEVATERVRSLEQRAGDVVVNARYAAPVVIGADGANSTVRRLVGVPATGELAIAMRGYARAGDGPPEQVIAWVREGWPAYVWSFPTGTGLLNVGYGLLRRRLRGGRAELAGRLQALLPDVSVDESTLRAHHLPFSPPRPVVASGRVLLAGDAASMVNPLSGEGISYALASGRLAAEAADDGAPGDRYARLIARELGRHFRHAAVAGRLLRAPFVVELATRAAGDAQATFDELVELGLGKARLTPGLVARLAAQPVRSAAASLRRTG